MTTLAGKRPSSVPWPGAGRADVLALVALIATWAWLFRSILSGRGLVFDGEVHEILLPIHQFLREQVLGRHRFPLWNPYLFLGIPWLGAIQAGPLYPVSWLFDALLPVERGLSWNIAVHFLLAGASAYTFARRALGVRAEAALVAAVIFAFNGHMVGNLGQLHNHATLAWAPLVLLAIHEATGRGGVSWRWIGIGGLALGLSSLGGMAQQSTYLAVLLAVYGTSRLAARRGRPNVPGSWADHALALGCIAGLGILIFAPQWRAADAFLAECARGSVTADRSLSVAAGSLSRADFLGLLFPNLVGWGALGAFNTSFIGAIPVALVVAGVWRALSQGEHARRIFAAVLVVALGFAAGRHDPLVRWLYQVPGVELFHDPSRAVAVALLACAMLAAGILDELGAGNEGARRAVLAAFMLCAVAIGGLRLAYWMNWIGVPESPAETYATEIPGPSPGAVQIASLAVLALALLAVARAPSPRFARRHLPAMLALLATVLLAWFATPFIRTEERATVERYVRGPEVLQAVPRAAETLGASRLANLDRDDVAVEPFESEFRWLTPTGFSSLVPTSVLTLTRASNDVDPLRLTAYPEYTRVPALLDLTASRYLLGRRPFPDRGEPIGRGEGFFLYENRSALPRAFVVSDACSAGVASALRGFTEGTVDPGFTAVLIDESLAIAVSCGDGGRTPSAARVVARSARIIVDQPDHLVVELEGAELAAPTGWLVVLDRFAPGWRVTVDGSARSVVRADVAFRAVEITRDSRRVDFVYAPRGQRALMALSLAGMALAVTLVFVPRSGTKGRGEREGCDRAIRALEPAPPGSARA